MTSKDIAKGIAKSLPVVGALAVGVGATIAVFKRDTLEDKVYNKLTSRQIIKNSRKLCITLHSDNGSKTILGKDILVEESEIIDAACMSKTSLCEFFEKEINAAKEEDILMSLHLKATMMKISDPIIFGHAVKVV